MKIIHFLSPFYKRAYHLMKLPFKRNSLGGGMLYQAKHIWKWSEPDNFWYLYDFAHKSQEERDTYVPYPVFRAQRNQINQRSFQFVETAEKFDYLCLLRDKFYFGQFLKSLGYRTPENQFIIFGDTGTYYNLKSGETSPLKEIQKECFDSYCKVTIGECGKGVFHLQIGLGRILINGEESDYNTFLGMIGNGVFLVQNTVVQHSAMQTLYPKSVNTLRIMTGRKANGECVFLSACLRVGAHGNTVDNWAKGGLALGLTDDGKLREEGHYEFLIDGKLTEPKHPDTGVVFKGYEIPYYKEAIEEAVNLHKLFYGIATIGWDISITEDGPCFIEGNDNYEISINQVADRGLKREWEDLVGSYQKQ